MRAIGSDSGVIDRSWGGSQRLPAGCERLVCRHSECN